MIRYGTIWEKEVLDFGFYDRGYSMNVVGERNGGSRKITGLSSKVCKFFVELGGEY